MHVNVFLETYPNRFCEVRRPLQLAFGERFWLAEVDGEDGYGLSDLFRTGVA